MATPTAFLKKAQDDHKDLVTSLRKSDEEVAQMYENFPPPDKWDNWVEYNAKVWPKKEKNTYQIVPTTCFNCESACGLTAFIDKESGEVNENVNIIPYL